MQFYIGSNAYMFNIDIGDKPRQVIENEATQIAPEGSRYPFHVAASGGYRRSKY